MNRLQKFGICGSLTAATLLSAAVSFAGSSGSPDTLPERVTAGGSSIYGVLVYSWDDDARDGVYEITKSGAILKFARPGAYAMTAGWLKDGKLCGYAEDKYGMTVRGRIYEEIDFATGRLLSQQEMEVIGNRFETATLNEDDGYIYGYGRMASGEKGFLKAPASDPTAIEFVSPASDDDAFISITFNPADGRIYGITKDYNHNLVTVDVTGTQTNVMKVPSASDVNWDYVTGLVYAPKENVFYWNKYEGEESLKSSLVTLDVATKTSKTVRTYTNEEQFSVYVCTDAVEVMGQPAKPIIDAISFPKGSLAGTLTFTLPSKDVDGAALAGNLDWEVKLDDTAYKSGSSGAGSKQTVEILNVSQGMHTFSVTVTAGKAKSEKAFENRYIGFDTPLAPANARLTQDGLFWDAVTTGVNGGYVDAAAVKYAVTLNGESKGETSATEMRGILPINKPLEWYTAEVTAKAGNLSSEPAVSNRHLAGKPMTLPVDLIPTREQFEMMQTFDMDGDSYSWKVRDGYMESMWALSKDGGDDWVILAPIEFPEASAVYSLEYTAKRNMPETGREKLQILIGREANPEAMTTVLVDTYEPLSEYSMTKEVFSVPEAGTWYIAFHATSLKYEIGVETGINVKDIKITKSEIGTDSPAAVTELSAVRGDKGALNATVTFRMPELTYFGKPITAPEVTATVAGAETKSVTGAPGSAQSLKVTTSQGQNVITVTTSIGSTTGTPTKIEVYTGVVVPDMVENLDFAIANDMLSVKMTWEAPSQGLSEGYVDPATTWYTIYEAVQSFYEMEWKKVGETAKGVTEFTYVAEDGMQNVHTLVVMAENVAGHGDQMSGGEVLLGTPYEMPFDEDFENGSDNFKYTPWVKYQPENDYSANWWVWPTENVIPSGTGNCLVGKPKEANTRGLMGMPAFAAGTEEGHLELSIDAFINANTPDLTITGLCEGIDNEVEIGRISKGDDSMMKTLVFILPQEFTKASWIQLFFNVYYPSSTSLLAIDNVKVAKFPSTGIETVGDCGGKVVPVSGGIMLKGFADKDVTVCNASGLTVFRGRIRTDVETLRLVPGIYVVNGVKIAVR